MTAEMPKTDDAVELMSYRAVVKCALDLGLPGNLKKKDYVDLLRLHRMGLDGELKSLTRIMKTKRQNMKKSTAENLVKKRSVGRPRKSKLKTNQKNIHTPTSVTTKIQVEKVHVHKIEKPMKSNSTVSEIQVYSSNSLKNTDSQSPIAKTTKNLLRNILLSSNRTRFNRSTTNTNFTSNNNSYYNYYQYDSSRPFNLNISHKASSLIENSSKITWKNNNKKSITPLKEIKSSLSTNSYLPDIQAFPDIPQLADVDINASFELDNSNNSINDPTDTDTIICIDDSDTLSNQSAGNIEQEQRDFDQRWAMSIRMENGEMSTPLVNCETFNSLEDGSLLGPHDTTLVQNDVIQNYIDTNDVQFMQLPDSSCEVIRTLQYYESGLLTSPWSFPENHSNDSILDEQSGQNENSITTPVNHTLSELTNKLPCPIAGCLWYSHSATLYVHLVSCHQQMISCGNSIMHKFRCQDIQSLGCFTHLQFIQNTIYIITVSFDYYSHTFVATIQYVSSYGDNTSTSSTTAVLTTGCLYNNDDQHSWSGPVHPYSVPLDVLHSEGRCLFIDPSNSDHVFINVNLTVPLINSNDFACL
ncbi:uncharacterized protein LOC112692360 isoform X2 [Sipha flava]|uniref:Uncharacterized protein LOC112692360 isoform X2 n=1 Tax=Sipha flava TaxID=143950 RepID=A0A8B8GIF6_9HEMI|nr:uncharacterized protein LOC112692360 isoform X2 [Sipha flava]